MTVSYNNRIIIFYLVTTFILGAFTTKRTHLREGYEPVRRDYRPSKWVANSAMDVWYGNKSMIDVISREFSDIMYKLTARPVRSPYTFDYIKPIKTPLRRNEEVKRQETPQEEPKKLSRVDIHFINTKNETFHTITLQSLKQLMYPKYPPLRTMLV